MSTLCLQGSHPDRSPANSSASDYRSPPSNEEVERLLAELRKERDDPVLVLMKRIFFGGRIPMAPDGK